ncbi:F-box only protein 39-like [Dendroctonus ponderosae]
MAQQYPDWTTLPNEILGNIFKLLPSRDKMSFSSTCRRWRDAVETPSLWKKLNVKVDEDFNEPSVIFLTQNYHHYIEELEIGWSVPYVLSEKVFCLRHKETVKRVGRFLILLFERFVQVKHLVIHEWYDIYQLKKLCYLLMRFLKQQNRLESLTLINANMNEMNFSNLLMACLRSKSTIKHIALHYSTYNSRKYFDSWNFANSVEMFYNLETLTIDCWIFLLFFNKVCILQVRICKLKTLNLYMDDTIRKLDTISIVRESQWEMFFVYLPRATVNLNVDKPMRDEQFKKIIQKHYPLITFTWNYPNYKESCYVDCCQCLERLANLQFKTLENIRLTLPLSEEQLKDKIGYIQKKCRKVKSFVFNNVELIKKFTHFESPVQNGVT